MRTSFFSILITALSLSASAQLDCPEKIEMRVIAESGLNLRAEPAIGAQLITTIPYDSILTSCTATAGSLTVDDIKGHWRQSIYKGQVGYLFDGFLEVADLDPQEPGEIQEKLEEADTAILEQPKPDKPEPVAKKPRNYQILTETYNFCGDVEKIDPGLLWYGFYPPEEEHDEDIRVMPVEVEVVLSKSRRSEQLEFDIQTDKEERSVFLLGTNRQINVAQVDKQDNSEVLRYSNHRIFPGQELTLGSGRKPLRLAATGSVKSSGDCPDLENYRLVLKAEKEQDLTPLLPSGQCGMPEVYWFGDFTGDGTPEIIFVSVYEDRNTFTLLVSENLEKGQLLRKETEWITEKCN